MLRTGGRSVVKMAILPKAIFRFHAIAIKILLAFSTEADRVILRCMEPLKTQNRPSNPQGQGKPEASYFQISNCITKLQ